MTDKNTTLIELSENPNARFWKVDFDELTEPERVFRAVWDLESDVNNGGFHQYLFNSSGDTAFFAAEALETIGALQMAAIVRDANAVFPDRVAPRDWQLRQEQLEALGEEGEERLEKLDDRFYEYPDDLTDLLYTYVMEHRGQITGLYCS